MGHHYDSTIETINLPNISLPTVCTLEKLVGSGALEKSYRARLQSTGQVVAVKFMHRHLWTNPDSRLSISARGSTTHRRSTHQLRCKVSRLGQSPHGGPYLVCEYGRWPAPHPRQAKRLGDLSAMAALRSARPLQPRMTQESCTET